MKAPNLSLPPDASPAALHRDPVAGPVIERAAELL